MNPAKWDGIEKMSLMNLQVMHEVSTKFILMISFLSLKGTEFCHFLKSTFNHISYQDKPVNWWDIELLGLIGGRGVGEQERECGLCSRTDQCSTVWGWEDVLSMSSLNFIINKSGRGYCTETQIAQHLRHWNHTTEFIPSPRASCFATYFLNLYKSLHLSSPQFPLLSKWKRSD